MPLKTNQRRFAAMQTEEEKRLGEEKLHALKQRKKNSPYAKQNVRYVNAMWSFLSSTGKYPELVDDNGERRYDLFTVEMFEEFTTSPKLRKKSLNGSEDVMLKRDSYSKYKSALFYLMRQKNMEPSTKLKKGIKNHLDLIGNENAEDAERGLVKATTGSPAWDLLFFKTLCRFLLKRGHAKDIWALAIIVMTFILISRINRTFKIRLEHMKWGEDFFTVYYPRSKTDSQGIGLGSKAPKHIYANVDEPSLNIVFILGLYLMTHDLSSGNLFSHSTTIDSDDYTDGNEEDQENSEDTNSLMEYLRGKVFQLKKNTENYGVFRTDSE